MLGRKLGFSSEGSGNFRAGSNVLTSELEEAFWSLYVGDYMEAGTRDKNTKIAVV